MRAVIMAGGKGTRLRPLTCHTPKPLIPLVEKPVMEYIIEWLKRFNITNIVVTIQYLGERIKEYFGDGSKWGVNITYFEEEKPLGTAGSVKNAENYLDDTFIVVSGDILADIDLYEAIEFHQNNQAKSTVIMTQKQIPLEYGGIVVSGDGKIKRFVEKPKWDEVYSDFVNTGIYILEPSILQYIPKNEYYDFGLHVFPKLLEKGIGLLGYCSNGYWTDIGTVQHYYQANMDILSKKVAVETKGEEVAPNVWIGKNVVIEEGVKIASPVFIGDGTIIDENSNIEPFSIIGANSIIGKSTRVAGSVIWANVHIGEMCDLSRSILANSTRLGTNVKLSENVVIGPNCRLKDKVTVKANVKLWPDKIICEGTLLHNTVVSEKTIRKSLFGINGISGRANSTINAEFITKIANAYGSMLQMDDKIIVASDGHPYAGLCMHIFSAAIRATGVGVDVCDESVVAPMVRYHISSQKPGYQGGVFFYVDETKEEIYLDFYDKDGYPLADREQRKIEQGWEEEEYRRVHLEEIGGVNRHDTLFSAYISRLKTAVSIHPLKRYKAAVMCKNCIRPFFEKLGSYLNCEVVFLEQTEGRERLGDYIRSNRVDFAILVSNSGERFLMIDEKGYTLTEEQLWSMYIMSTLLLSSVRRIPIPQSAPTALDFLIEQLKGEAIRTKGNRREQLTHLGDYFHFFYDALFAFIQTVQLLCMEEKPLSKVIERFPNMHVLRGYVSCPWNTRGYVMRKLIEDTSEKEVDFTEGIKVYHADGGWTLILPELEKPRFTIYAQSDDLKKAREVVTYYIKKIRQYQNV